MAYTVRGPLDWLLLVSLLLVGLGYVGILLWAGLQEFK